MESSYNTLTHHLLLFALTLYPVINAAVLVGDAT